jgi:hypothetical protein
MAKVFAGVHRFAFRQGIRCTKGSSTLRSAIITLIIFLPDREQTVPA